MHPVRFSYLQVDLGQIMKISAIFSQGHPTDDAWVKSFTVEFSDTNRDDWRTYLNHEGTQPIEFKANTDR